MISTSRLSSELELAAWTSQNDCANGTAITYNGKLRIFKLFCETHGYNHFPTTTFIVGNFLRHLILQGLSHSTVDGYIAAISKTYRYTEFVNPCQSALITGISKVAKRLGPSSVKKIPTTTSHMRKLAVVVNPFSFIDVRDHLAFCIMFKGFLRAEQIARLRPGDLWIEIVNGVKVLFIFIEKAKNDQYRRGNTVIIGPGLDATFCPIEWFARYNSLRESNAAAFFHKANNAPDKHTAFLVPATFNSRFKERCMKAGITVYLTSHCLRAGGITTALARGVDLRLAKRHGNWKSDAVYAYITESLANILSVTNCF